MRFIAGISPQALQDKGGWTNRDCAQWFADYANVVAHRYGDRVKRFATFNEPSVFTLFGFCLGGQARRASSTAACSCAPFIMWISVMAPRSTGCAQASRTLRLGAIHTNCQPCRPATEKPEDRRRR